MKSLQMNELTNKYIIMCRIAVSLHNKGLVTSITLTKNYFWVAIHYSGVVVDSIFGSDFSEEELLNWWSIIEDGTGNNE